jgi:geranylgeranyl diphosphate synthase type I
MATDSSPRAAPIIADVVAMVEAVLDDFVRAEASALAAVDPALAALAATARDAVLGGGKRVRPTFAYWGWRGAGGPAEVTAVMPALAALEVLHAFALVHDDVMDESPTRRGQPTAHRALAGWHTDHRLRGDAVRFGRSTAILVGDLCLVWADELISRSPIAGDRLQSARAWYDRMRVEAVAGQFLDVLGESALDWTVERALLTARLKTASYTVTRPLLYGAALADGPVDDRLAAAYEAYGAAVGEAFQLRDDLLDLYGEPAVTRKPVGGDVSKPTVLLQLAERHANRRQAAELRRLRRRGARTDVARLAELVAETGAAEHLHHMIDQRMVTAKAALAVAPIDGPTRDALECLATAMAWRVR